MSSTADNANTTPQVDGTTRSAAVTDHTQESDAVADTVTSTVDGVDKPAKAEGASPNDDATKTDAADQSSTADGPSADQMPQGASDKAEDDTAVVKAEKRDPTTEQLDRYKRRFQIWDIGAREWRPYDRSSYVPPPPIKEDLSNYFYIDVRYKNPDKPPQEVFCRFSKTLEGFFRSTFGGNWFSRNAEIPVQDCFPDLVKLQKRLTRAKEALESEFGDFKSERDVAKSLGCKAANDESTGNAVIRQYLLDLVEHLSVFVKCVEHEFSSTSNRLDLLRTHGHIEYDLLIYLFEEDKEYYYQGNSGKIAFQLRSREYVNDVVPYFLICGKTVVWDGKVYGYLEHKYTIKKFTGSVEITSLTYQSLTPEVKETLAGRGRLYTELSGMHYRTYKGQRVIIDRIAYENKGGYTRAPDVKIPELREAYLHLLPPEVLGFNLATKRWSSFLVTQIRPVVFDENAWDHLVLDPDTKTLIRALVGVTKNSVTSTKIISDVISGKGGGLVSVLHGPPGTGKTLTAEAVAESLRRPLYMVGSSELPSSPSSLEARLKDILLLATAWDAVLLIDEADVYMEKRSLHELDRNAMVSVVLRSIEYHRGCLFLTTNRVKSFDDAFLSRISIAIQYPELDAASRYTIWSKFLAMAGYTIRSGTGGEEFSEESDEEDDGAVVVEVPKGVDEHGAKTAVAPKEADVPVDEVKDDSEEGALAPAKKIRRRYIDSDTVLDLAKKPFNGRNIKNIVRTAQALALSQDLPLGMQQIQVVVRSQEKFIQEFAL